MASEQESSVDWETETGDASGDDDMEYELATESSQSGYEDIEVEEEEEGQEEGTTLYFDAEDGTFRDEDGDVVRFAVDGEEEGTAEDEEEEEDDEEEGSRTPRRAEAGEDEAAETTPATAARQRQTITITQQHLIQLLSHAGLRGIFAASGPTTRSMARGQHVALDEEEAEDDSDVSFGYSAGRRRRRARRTVDGDRYPKIPSEEGKQLMAGGMFGANDRCDHTSCGVPFTESTMHKRRRLARRMLDRELGFGSRGRQRALNSLATQDLIPGSKADTIIHMNDRCYSGQFSDDGSFFFAAGKDFKVRMYDTSNPYDWKYYKTVHYYGGSWTITDASLSPDNRHLAYSSIRAQVCLAPTDPNDDSEPQLLDFSDMGTSGRSGGGRGWGRSQGNFGIWSIRFSGDGGEIVAGTGDSSVYVYDLETRRSILRIPGHTDDVNAVCFGDKMSPHILYSGSDDTTLKVWDRRSLSSYRPAGMFLGHTEGLTYIDSKGDGRYVISNAKDQTCKLWDLRKMVSTDVGERLNPQDYTTNFDYRFSPYDVDEHQPHPHDCSLVTFRGHRVLKTLIRCHFSPAFSTDQRYIYSGSHDGKIYVWNLDGTQKSTIDVLAATRNSRPASDERFAERYDYYGRSGQWRTIVRDCSWHPSAPIIAATSWNGWDHGLGTCTVHSWSDGVEADEVGDAGAPDKESGAAWSNKGSLGATPMGARVTANLGHDERFYGLAREGGQRERPRNSLGARMGLGALWGDEDEDEN